VFPLPTWVDSPFNKKEWPCNQWKAIGLMVIIAYIKMLIEGEVSGLRPRTSPFWVFVVTMCIFEIFFSGKFSSVLYMMVGHHIWWGPAGFGRSTKSFSIYFFGKFTLGLSLGAFPLPCGSQPLGHINHYTIILPC
jgi:hypothetical protein